MMMLRPLRRVLPRSTFGIGVMLLVLMAIAGTALFNKNRILTAMRDGDTIRADFRSGSTLVPYLSQVKVAFVPVGVVTGVSRQSDGTALVTLKVNKGVRNKLGSDPSAMIRPTTLLGGNYFVDLAPGGDQGSFGDTIPLSRTHMPVELDNVVAALQPSALKGMQTASAKLDGAFTAGAGSALDQLAADAPRALRPAAAVLSSAQGMNRYTDLTQLVQGLENTGRALTVRQGQLDDIVTKLRTTTSLLSARAQDLSDTFAELPATLTSADTGLNDLSTTLAKLRDTADPAEPSVKKLSTLLNHANPVLTDAAPVLSQLNQVLVDLDPAVRALVPVSTDATSTLNAVQGPVLDRVNGPIKQTLLSPYHGLGPYKGSGSDKPLYQEIGYTLVTLDRVAGTVDRNGNMVGFNPGPGVGSVGGMPISLEQMFKIFNAHMNTTGNGGQ